MKHLELIYLDVAFITWLYEETMGIAVPTRVIKTSDSSGAVSGLGTLYAGASAKEQKEYPLDARAMFEKLGGELAKFPKVDLMEKKDSELPEVFWLDGVVGMARSSLNSGTKEIASTHYCQYVPSIEHNTRIVKLATNDVYFSSGYDQLSRYGPAFACDFAIRARLLVRMLFYDDYHPFAAPFVILKQGNSPQDP